MRIWITAAQGQLGKALTENLPDAWQALTTDVSILNICDEQAVEAYVAEERPQVIVNTAAYTAVDRAESEPDQAFAVNARAVRHLARIAKTYEARLIHISTDFVFDGKSSVPYAPDAPTNPLSVYGRSKSAGEQHALEESAGAAVVVRTAWLYSEHGQNFAKTMLRLFAERPVVRVVDDQIGTPTSATTLAGCLVKVVEESNARGVLHLTNAGVASWYDFAVAIYEEATQLGLLSSEVQIEPIPSREYPTPAKRPAYSVLDKTGSWAAVGCTAEHWRSSLRQVLQRLQKGNAA